MRARIPYFSAIFISLACLIAPIAYLHCADLPTFLIAQPTHSQVKSPADMSHLVVELAQTSSSPPRICALVRNTDPSTTFTFLTWDTPLDPLALSLGLFEITDVESGRLVDIPRIMVNRVFPPARDSLVELKPGEKAEREFTLGPPKVPLEKGKTYEFVAKGSWGAIWARHADAVSEEDLRELGRAAGGEFIANKATAKIS